MSSTWQERVRPVAAALVEASVVEGLVIAVATGEGEPEFLAVGADAAGRTLVADDLFPVASISKLAVALAALRLVAAGRLALDDGLGTYLPEAAAARPGVTIRAILCHTAGLPYDLAADAAPYTTDLDGPTLTRACLATPAEAPGRQVRYSNVGSGLLAIVVERLTGRPFPVALDELVLAPLGVDGYLGAEPPRPPARIASDFGELAGTELEAFNSSFWRSLGMAWGGMVTNAAGALRLVRAFAGVPAGFLPPALLAEAVRDQTGGLSGGFWEPLSWSPCPWGLGVELRGDKEPHWMPVEVSAGSYGHVGASGCYAWYDPAAKVAWAMLGTHTFQTWWERWPEIGRAIVGGAG